MLRWFAATAVLGLAASAALAADAPPARSPEKIYSITCGYCHGRNVGPIILGRHIPADTVKYIVRHGQNAMPAFRPSEITPAELEAVAKWVEDGAARTGEHGQ